MNWFQNRGPHFENGPFSLRYALCPLHIAVVLGVFVLDQITKVLVIFNIPIGTHIPVLPFFDLVHSKNKGAAFGMFNDSSPMFRFVFFGLVSALCLYLLLHWLSSTPKHYRWQRVALSLILGGALGNLLDRACFGQVTDFLDVWYGDYHWPAFNIADSGITVGVTMLFLMFFFPAQKSVQSKK